MARVICAIICLCCWILPTQCNAGLLDCPNIAVLGFHNKAAVSQELTFDDAGLVTEFVIDGLLDTDRFNIIEREQLREITDEHSYNATGLIDMNTVAQIGKLYGVQYLVTGSVVGLSLKDKEVSYNNTQSVGIGNTQHTVIANITARVIDVETGRIVMTARGKGESTSTKTEFSLNKTNENTDSSYYNDSDDSSTSTQTITIGTVAVSQVQVHNALYKAAEDLVYGEFGFLNKMAGKGQRKIKH